MRLSVPALRRTRPEMFVNYIRGAFSAPEPGVTKKLPPPPQTESRTSVHRSPAGLAGRDSRTVRRSQALQAAAVELEKGTRSPSRRVTRPPHGPGKNWSPGGPRYSPTWTLMIPNQEPSAPIPRLPCHPTAALGRVPGKEEAKDSRGLAPRRSERASQPWVGGTGQRWGS